MDEDDDGPIAFIGAVYGSRSDKDGEMFITFRVPRSDAPKASAVAMIVERTMLITVKPEANNGGHDAQATAR